MWERVGPGEDVFSIHYSHLGPTVLESVVLPLFPGERAPSSSLLVHLIKQVSRLGGGLTFSPTVSVSDGSPRGWQAE